MRATRRTLMWISALVVGASLSTECQPSESVRITTGEIRIDYCDADADLAMAAIHVTVVFTNRGKRNLILSHDFGPAEPDEDVTVSDQSGAVVYAPHPTYLLNEVSKLGAAPDDKMFEIIKPGASVERDLVIGLPISKDPRHRIGSIPAQGGYQISATRSTWPWSYQDEPKQVRERWKRYGLLLITQVRIRDIPIKISLPPQMPVCK